MANNPFSAQSMLGKRQRRLNVRYFARDLHFRHPYPLCGPFILIRANASAVRRLAAVLRLSISEYNAFLYSRVSNPHVEPLNNLSRRMRSAFRGRVIYLASIWREVGVLGYAYRRALGSLVASARLASLPIRPRSIPPRLLCRPRHPRPRRVDLFRVLQRHPRRLPATGLRDRR